MMKIIDVHAHLGDDCVFDHHITEEDLLEGYRGTFVEGAIVQLTPIGHAVDPESEDGMFVFSVARELGVPVMVHTGTGLPFSQPVKILKAAQKYPDVKIVLAHSGMDWFTHQAILVAEQCPNIYLETTWTGIFQTKEVYQKIGPDRLMFASDHVNNVSVELEKYRQILKPEDMEQVMWKTAKEVFCL